MRFFFIVLKIGPNSRKTMGLSSLNDLLHVFCKPYDKNENNPKKTALIGFMHLFLAHVCNSSFDKHPSPLPGIPWFIFDKMQNSNRNLNYSSFVPLVPQMICVIISKLFFWELCHNCLFIMKNIFYFLFLFQECKLW